jgi:transposase, IS30 family
MMSYSHLTFHDRIVIKKMLKINKSLSKISLFIGVHRSTISREIKRNAIEYFYHPYYANEKYLNRRKQSKIRKIEMYPCLKKQILDKLKDGWSPDIISGRLKILFKDDNRMHINHESIYLWIYSDQKELFHLLPRGIRKRQRRTAKKKNRMQIPDRKSIHTRPKSVESRKFIGHWEGDTIVGKGGQGYISTLVERKSKLLAAGIMTDKRPDSCNRSILEAFGEIENSSIKTITFDNGTEFYNYKNLEVALECPIYFADPYSSWQRGTNERTNGMIRKFFPKSMSFNNLSQKDVDEVVFKLNNRPRKSLEYRTPFEVFNKLSVALHH